MQKLFSFLIALFILGGLLFWIVTSPAEAGNTAGGAVTGIVGMGANLWEAIATFFDRVVPN